VTTDAPGGAAARGAAAAAAPPAAVAGNGWALKEPPRVVLGVPYVLQQLLLV
jgi:hypothetical protein